MRKCSLMSIIALAALSMTSCSNDEVLQAVPTEQAIEFGTYLGRDVETRGIVLDNNNLMNFGVFASYTSENDWTSTIPNFMFNQSVSRTSTTAAWEYTPKKYWPTNQGDKISFWAYAPYATTDNGISVTSTKETATVPEITYTINTTNLNTQADFVTDVEMDLTKEATANPDGTTRSINFGLRHELTRVAINACLDKTIDDATKVNITKVEFGGVNFATVAKYTFGNASNERGVWTPTTVGTTLDITGIMNTSAASGLGEYNKKGVILTGTSSVSLFEADKYLFLIPFANGITSEEVKITVCYDIVTKDEALVGEYSKTSATKVITLPTSAVLLKQGMAYNFNLKFYMNEIVLSATVEENWGDAIDNDQNVDWNDTDLQ